MTFSRNGFGAIGIVVILAIVLAAAGGGYYWFSQSREVPAPQPTAAPSNTESAGAQNTREMSPAVSTRALCEAKCRDQYGGSASAGFDACIRACGAGGALREAACAEPGPACPSPDTPECKNGKWICVGPAKGVN